VNVLVLYDTQFGNTAQVASAIAASLRKLGAVRLASIADVQPAELDGVDLLIIGGPTEEHTARQPLRTWLRQVPDARLENLKVATFDTHVAWPGFLPGSAARVLAKSLRRRGARLLVPPESFLLAGTKGPLKEGELERAEAWGTALAAQISAHTPAHS
jgi:flavodoxin I